MDEEGYVTERRPDIWLKSLLASLVNDKVEWKEIMGAVRNQGNHDSCWAVVVSELIMAILRIRDDPSITLSPQDLLDFCAERTESLSMPGHFCYPFPFPGAFNYVKENGIQKEQHRPYIGCSEVVPSRYRDPMQCAYIKDFLSLGSIERAVRQFRRHQPVGAHLAIFSPDFVDNHKEIYRGPATVTSKFEALHAVTLIDGGTTEEGENYVVARLSNGPKWGDNGYVKVSVSTWIKLKNPDRTSAKPTAKMFFSTPRQLLFNFVCPTLLSPDEENTKRKRKRALEFVNIFKNKRRKLSQT